LFIVKDGAAYYVKKIAKDLDYNVRLKAQCKKQKEYKSNIFKPVRVKNEGFGSDGLFYFTMEYINGITLADSMQNIELSRIKDIAEMFLSMIPIIIEPDPKAPSVFRKKAKKLAIELGKDIGGRGEGLKDILDYSWDYISHSPCHGDLTLENIILANGEVYLLDFLDSFYDSWLIDLAKVFQDIDTYWHYRKMETKNVNLNIRLLILKNTMVERIMLRSDGDRIMDSLYHVLLINLFRIVPYTKDKLTMDWLDKQIAYVRMQIRNKGWRLL
jgi:hypothetical protein